MTISQRLQKYVKGLRWPRLRHLELGSVYYELPLSSRRVDMSAFSQLLPEAGLEYLAGFFDGDGYVGAHTSLSGCTLSVGQSVCGQEVLLAFLRVFGGTVRVLSHGKGCKRPCLQWQIHGKKSGLAAQLLQEHCVVKKEQLSIAATWPSNTLERIHCSSRLAELKKRPLCPPKTARLSWSYVAGFFDAEGCIKVCAISKSVKLELSQKDPAVLLSIKSFLQSETGSHQVSGPHGVSCKYIMASGFIAVTRILQQLLVHGLLVKRVTASNVLASMLFRASHAELRKTGFSNKGNQKRYARLDAAGCERARQIKVLQTSLQNSHGGCERSETLKSQLVTMQLEHKIASTQSRIQLLRADIASIQRMFLEDSSGNGFGPASDLQ